MCLSSFSPEQRRLNRSSTAFPAPPIQSSLRFKGRLYPLRPLQEVGSSLENMSGAADTGSVASSGDERDISVACITNDELANIINGSKASLAKGVPVLIVPSSDGRLAAVAVNGLQILVPTTTTTNCKEDGASMESRDGEGKPKDISAWLLLLASLTASVTYAAGLAPPGGVWGTDDKANRYVAGNPVLRDKSPRRYKCFQYGNSTAFVASLLIIAMLSNPKRSTVYIWFFRLAVGLCLLGLAFSFVSATPVDIGAWVYTLMLYLALMIYVALRKLYW